MKKRDRVDAVRSAIPWEAKVIFWGIFGAWITGYIGKKTVEGIPDSVAQASKELIEDAAKFVYERWTVVGRADLLAEKFGRDVQTITRAGRQQIEQVVGSYLRDGETAGRAALDLWLDMFDPAGLIRDEAIEAFTEGGQSRGGGGGTDW